MRRTPEGRLHFQAEQQIARRHAALVRANKCLRCWYSPLKCICTEVRPLAVPHEVIVLLHHKEYGRLSNTGKLIAASCPNSTVFIAGIPEHERLLREKLASSPHPAFVLFPAVGSISVPELLKRNPPADSDDASIPPQKRAKVSEGQGAEDGQVRPFTIVIVDGTWNQAKHVVRAVPNDIPRVHVDPTAPSLFVLRTQTQPDRICTLEAFALLLREMGHDVGLPQTLLSYLKHHVDTALEDRGCNSIYGNDDGDAEEEVAPGKPASIDRKALKANKRKRNEEAIAARAAVAEAAAPSQGTSS